MATKKTSTKKKAAKKKVAKKKVTKKTTKKKGAKKATPKRKPVVKRSNELTKTSTNVEQPKEDVMGSEWEHPIDDKAFQKVLHKLCTDAVFREDIIRNPTLITSQGLTSNQLAIIIMVGKETGHYEFDGRHVGACCTTTVV